jgi:NAD(P)-dependent dehydrogenase (short-subunit alcohol dehydrogenase family)
MKIERVIITGGTSGLGLELVKLFLERGAEVMSLGRIEGKVDHPRHRFYKCDFTSLTQVSETALHIAKKGDNIDLIINNAGILSQPEYTESMDGFEISYQVNFLAHFYFFQILQESGILNKTTIINTTSPMRKHGKLEQDWIFDRNAYGTIKAYASTKLYVYLFTSQLASTGFSSFAFDPGTFSSGIYRAQNPWFHVLYKIAAPFMVSSERVAKDFMAVYDKQHKTNGAVYDRKGRVGTPVQFDIKSIAEFWDKVNSQLSLNGSKVE